MSSFDRVNKYLPISTTKKDHAAIFWFHGFFVVTAQKNIALQAKIKESYSKLDKISMNKYNECIFINEGTELCADVNILSHLLNNNGGKSIDYSVVHRTIAFEKNADVGLI
ncbi:hypothetical protein L3i20_v245010 [Paenibacillus sp. L3-i20]|nr:hypothetical protein L3i20_v245010 [Paenibacillus sp. L3-i20]